jgi:hypothetical protein
MRRRGHFGDAHLLDPLPQTRNLTSRQSQKATERPCRRTHTPPSQKSSKLHLAPKRLRKTISPTTKETLPSLYPLSLHKHHRFTWALAQTYITPPFPHLYQPPFVPPTDSSSLLLLHPHNPKSRLSPTASTPPTCCLLLQPKTQLSNTPLTPLPSVLQTKTIQPDPLSPPSSRHPLSRYFSFFSFP